MEWISFSLDHEKKIQFEQELMPSICKRYGSLLQMSNETWNAYYERNGLENYRCLFCSDSVVLLKFVKDFAGSYTRHFTTPETDGMEYFGDQHLDIHAK